MSLRQSPARTSAFLAANRANAQKSTGPRTAAGKGNVGLGDLAHGRRARRLLAFLAQADEAWFAPLPPPATGAGLTRFGLPPPFNYEAHPYTAFCKQAGGDRQELLGIYRALYAASEPGRNVRLVRQIAIYVWAASRNTLRRVRSRAWRETNLTPGGALPRPWRLVLRTGDRRRGWHLTISLWMRRGRGRARDPRLASGYDWQEGRRTLVAGLTITASMRHPALGYRNVWEVAAGEALRIVVPVKPESFTKQKGFRIDIPAAKAATDSLKRACRRAAELWAPYIDYVYARGKLPWPSDRSREREPDPLRRGSPTSDSVLRERLRQHATKLGLPEETCDKILGSVEYHSISGGP